MTDAASLHRQMLDVITARDLDGLRALYHPDYSYEGSDGVEHKGADAGIEMASTYLEAFSDLSLEVRHELQCGEHVSVIEFTGRGTHDGDLEGIAPTGRTVEIPVCNVVEVADGKILREREYFDTAVLLRQLGVTS